VVTALLDPVNGMDFQAVEQFWGDQFPQHQFQLRRFFISLQNALLEDKIYGPILEHYQTLRIRQDVQKALLERGLPTSDAPIVHAISATISGDGALAYGDGSVAVGAGATYIGGDFTQIVLVTIQQFLGGKDGEEKTTDIRRRYFQHVSQRANLLPWIRITEENASPEQGGDLHLADIYIDLDTNELERKHLEHEEELRQYLAHRKETERISAQKMVNRERSLLILGDPGSGKSAFVKHLTYLMAQANLAERPNEAAQNSISGWEHGALLPIRVELRYLADFAQDQQKLKGAKLLLKFIRNDLADWGMDDCWPIVESALRKPEGGALILLDGLDEAPTAQRQRVVDAVSDLREMYPSHRYLVTCRPYAYVGQPWRLHGFHEVTLAPFDEEQIDRYIDNWYERLAERQRLETRQLALRKAQSLKEAVRRRDLLGLAERPLLLAVMAQLHAYHGQLPEDRTQLYYDAVHLLLERWEGHLGTRIKQESDVEGHDSSNVVEQCQTRYACWF